MDQQHRELLQQASELARAHKPTDARQLILQVLDADHFNIAAWWGLANIGASIDERRHAAKSVLRLNPSHSKAQELLDRLNTAQPVPQQSTGEPEFFEFEELPLETPAAAVTRPIATLVVPDFEPMPLDHDTRPLDQMRPQQATPPVMMVDDIPFDLTPARGAGSARQQQPMDARTVILVAALIIPIILLILLLSGISSIEGALADYKWLVIAGAIIGGIGLMAVASRVFNLKQTVNQAAITQLIYTGSVFTTIASFAVVLLLAPDGDSGSDGSGLPFAPASARGQLVFTANQYQTTELFTIGIDGTGMRQLTTNNEDDRRPIVSPDGRLIAFYSTRSPSGIWVMNSDGSNPRFLAPGRHAAWSPDGQRIAFVADQLCIVDISGGEPTCLLREYSNGMGELRLSAPSWSPDGRELVFSSRVGSTFSLHIIDINTGTRRWLVDDASAPSWSPDGSRITFAIMGEPPPTVLYGSGIGIGIINSDGSDFRVLSDNVDRNPAWSPDGRRIAFESRRDGNSEIYVMNADGSNVQRVTTSSYGDYNPDWLR